MYTYILIFLTLISSVFSTTYHSDDILNIMLFNCVIGIIFMALLLSLCTNNSNINRHHPRYIPNYPMYREPFFTPYTFYRYPYIINRPLRRVITTSTQNIIQSEGKHPSEHKSTTYAKTKRR